MRLYTFLSVFFLFCQSSLCANSEGTSNGSVSGLVNSHSTKQIRIVGSTAVYAFSTSVAEHFGKLTHYKAPLIEATGTGGGFRIFCQGLKTKYGPDGVNASRSIDEDETELCKQNGAADVQEFILGHDGIVLASLNNDAYKNVKLAHLFKALSKVIHKDGKWVENPFEYWSDIDKTLPHLKIKILGPPPASGTYSVLVELILKRFCPKTESKCMLIRSDGAYIQASEHETVIAQKLNNNPEKLAIFSFGFLQQNKHNLTPLSINDVLPSIDSIRGGKYPLSRLLYFYTVSKKLSDPQLVKFLHSFYEPKSIGARGYLTLKGLVPLNADELAKMKAKLEMFAA